jgi:hypothetical protein
MELKYEWADRVFIEELLELVRLPLLCLDLTWKPIEGLHEKGADREMFIS